jgi:hypothetical protein
MTRCHRATWRHDVAVRLELGDELVGRQEAERRVLPAKEGLDADELLRVGLPDRLVDEAELVLGQRRGHAELHLEPELLQLGELRVEDVDAVLPAGLGVVERHVGVL